MLDQFFPERSSQNLMLLYRWRQRSNTYYILEFLANASMQHLNMIINLAGEAYQRSRSIQLTYSSAMYTIS